MVGGSVLDGAYVFVSYSREDSDYVHRLVEFLGAHGVRAWFDQQIPNGARWRETLEERVERAAAVLLVESRTARESNWVNQEFLYAEKKGRPLLILVLDGELRLGLQGMNAEFIEGKAMPTPGFVAQARTLLEPSVGHSDESGELARAAPERWQFPPVPAGMVDRPQVDTVVHTLTAGSGTVAVAGVFGGGGFGKTIAARMVCARSQIQAAFPGGLLWVELGQERRGPSLAATITGLCRRLGGAVTDAQSAQEAGRTLAGLLANRSATLVVIDDAWFPDQLAPFLDADIRPARLLITTRIVGLLPDDVTPIKLDQLDPDQAWRVLTDGLPPLPDMLIQRLTRLLGGWALAVKAANAALRAAVRDGRNPIQVGTWLADTLAAEGPEILDLGHEHSRKMTIAATLQASLHLLDDSERNRYFELGVFAEDTDIDFATLSLLWATTGRLSLREARRLAARLHEQSLVTDYRPETATLRLHDVVRAHLREQLGPDGVIDTHRALLQSTATHYALDSNDNLRAWWNLPDSADYLWGHLTFHLDGADLDHELDALLDDLRWFAGKLARLSAADIDADLARGKGSVVGALRRALRLEGHLLGPISPMHSHQDVLLVRLSGDPRLAEALRRFDATSPGNVTRLRSVWPLPDLPDAAARRVLSAHRARVTAVAIFPDGTRLATATAAGSIRISEVATGAQLATLAGHSDRVTAVRIAPDGTWLATASDDSTVRIWDAETGVQRAKVTGHGSRVTALAISPDGTWLATASDDSTVRIWDTKTAVQRANVIGHSTWVTAVAVSPDGTWLVTASGDGTVRIWDAETGAPRATLAGHNEWVTAVAIAADGSWLASASADGTVRTWQADTGAHRATITGRARRLTAVAIAPDDTWLATAGSDGMVRIWDIATGELKARLTGHGSWVTALAVSPDGTWLATASHDRTARIWDIDIATREPQARLTGHSSSVNAVAVAPDGTWLATASHDGTARVWDAVTGMQRAILTGHHDETSAVAIAPDGSWLATASHDGTARIWDAETWEQRTILTGHSSWMTAVAIAPDATWLATANYDRSVRIWDAGADTSRTTLTGHSSWVTAVAIAPDGSWLATASADRTVRIWEAATGAHRMTLSGHGSWLTAVAIAPDGTWLATASADATVRIWEAETGAQRTVLTGHGDRVTAVAIAPDGTWLATASDDGTLRTWDIATASNTASMRFAGQLSAVAIANDCATLFTAGAFGPYRFELHRPRALDE